ncbi:hypothetical protein ACHQM5_021069 [Ranunculus cassubicifolius]
MCLRRSLQHIRKGNLSMQDFLSKAKCLSDSLAAAGIVVSENDLKQNILTGLDSAYDATVTTLTTFMTSISMSDFQAHLLAFDMRLEDQTRIQPDQPSANVARRSSSNSGRSNFRSNPHNQNQQHSRNDSRDNRQFSKNGSHSSSFYKPQSNEGPCQICGRRNHAAYNCFNRFKQSFNPPTMQPPSTQSSGHAYIAHQAPHHREVNWYMDSGATNHITNDFSALRGPTEYDGTDQIRVGNGSSLPISHVGTSSISNSLQSFILRDVFYVPKVSSNLLSVSQFSCPSENMLLIY